MVEPKNEADSTTIDISELSEIVKEGAEMIDQIFDGENVIPEEATIVSVPKHTLLAKQELEESKENSSANMNGEDGGSVTTPNLAQIRL